jgi:hypothetical protein
MESCSSTDAVEVAEYERRVLHEVQSQQYLVLPIEETSDPLTVTVEAGTYAVEWFAIGLRSVGEAPLAVPAWSAIHPRAGP